MLSSDVYLARAICSLAGRAAIFYRVVVQSPGEILCNPAKRRLARIACQLQDQEHCIGDNQPSLGVSRIAKSGLRQRAGQDRQRLGRPTGLDEAPDTAARDDLPYSGIQTLGTFKEILPETRRGDHIQKRIAGENPGGVGQVRSRVRDRPDR